MIIDSGERREFESGAVRDIQEGKGRCDLLPLEEASELLNSSVLHCIACFMKTGSTKFIYLAVEKFINTSDWTAPGAVLELSVHYEEGCKKYGERNWEKGIPLHCYIDSGVRHYLKHLRGDEDERHDRAFLWNMFGALWTINNKPELNDLPFNKQGDNNDN